MPLSQVMFLGWNDLRLLKFGLMRWSVDHSWGTWTRRTQMSGPRQTQSSVMVFALACRVLAHTRVFRFLNYFTTLKTGTVLYKKKDYGLYRIRSFWDTEPCLTHCCHEVARAVDRAAFEVKANGRTVRPTRYCPLFLPASLTYVPGPARIWVRGLRYISGVKIFSALWRLPTNFLPVLSAKWFWSSVRLEWKKEFTP